jgi:hypothetical protein
LRPRFGLLGAGSPANERRKSSSGIDPEVKQLMRLAYGLASNGTGKGVDEWMSTPFRDLVEWAEVVDEAIKDRLIGPKRQV